MAVPKRRQSKQRQRKRRTHYKAETPAFRNCPRCGDPKLPHRVCATCGFYRDEKRLDVEEF